jgi:hypothetical protein
MGQGQNHKLKGLKYNVRLFFIFLKSIYRRCLFFFREFYVVAV